MAPFLGKVLVSVNVGNGNNSHGGQPKLRNLPPGRLDGLCVRPDVFFFSAKEIEETP